MLKSLLSNLLCGWFVFLIPAYSTWKVLSHQPNSQPDIDRWAKYWVCVGGLVAVESAAGWILSWMPFYWEIRTIFLLFLALPQTQGSTLIYDSYIDPFFRQNEAELDASIQASQTNTVAFAQAKLQALWETLWRLATRQSNSANAAQFPQQPGAQGQYPQAPSPASVFAMGANLFQTYGGGAMGALQRSIGMTQSAGAATGTQPRPSPGLQQRPPIYASSSAASGVSSRSGQSSHSNTPPPFPEPYRF